MSAAPLNPKYKSEEFEFYLSDLKPKLLIVDHNSKNPAVDVANKLKIPVCEIKKQKDAPSGFFNLFEKFLLLLFLKKLLHLILCLDWKFFYLNPRFLIYYRFLQ